MTTATRSVAVVATQLPSIDRRALSQAWYSALHLAAPSAKTGAPPVARPVPGGAVARRSASGSAGVVGPCGGRSAATAPRVRAQREAIAPAVAERRGPASDLSRRIERALVRHVPEALDRPATVAIKAADGRVALLVRTDGASTRVVALCAPHLREAVDRALAHARFALAAGGTRVEATSR